MGKLRGYLVGIALVVGAILLAILLVSIAPKPEQRETSPYIPYVETAQVMEGGETVPVRGAGTVKPVSEIDLIPQVSGKVEWVSTNFVSGGRVTEDEVLIRIESADYVFNLLDAQADLAQQEVNLLQAQEKAIAARREYETYSKKEDRAERDSLKASRLTLHEPQLQAAQAALDRAEARVVSTQTALARTEIKAPFDGFVREESVSVGQYLIAGTEIGSIFTSDLVEVKIPLSDSHMSLLTDFWSSSGDVLSDNTQATVFAQYGEHRYIWEAYVHRAAASLDRETRTLEVVVRIPNPFGAGRPEDATKTTGKVPPLLIGKFVTVELYGRTVNEFFRIPRLALQPDNQVWVVREDQTLDVVEVHVIQRDRDQAYVTGNLSDDKRVVISGIDFAIENMNVRSQAH